MSHGGQRVNTVLPVEATIEEQTHKLSPALRAAESAGTQVVELCYRLCCLGRNDKNDKKITRESRGTKGKHCLLNKVCATH